MLQIKEYPIYFITINGEIINSITGRQLKKTISLCGYYQITLRNHIKSKTVVVHRILMDTYLPNDKTLDVNHIDGNKLNNNINNLELCTRSENIKHAYRLGLSKGVFSPKIVLDTQNGIFYESALQASKYYNINYTYLISMLSKNCKNKTSLIYV